MNPALEMMLEKARYHGLPKDVVERAILKGSGQLEGEEMKEVLEAKDRTKARKDCSTEMDLCYIMWNIRG